MIEAAKAQPLAKHGANQHRQEVRSEPPAARGETQAYLLRRIARDQPELLNQIGPDKPHRSARAAAIAAGIIKPVPTVRLVDDPPKVARPIICFSDRYADGSAAVARGGDGRQDQTVSDRLGWHRRRTQTVWAWPAPMPQTVSADLRSTAYH